MHVVNAITGNDPIGVVWFGPWQFNGGGCDAVGRQIQWFRWHWNTATRKWKLQNYINYISKNVQKFTKGNIASYTLLLYTIDEFRNWYIGSITLRDIFQIIKKIKFTKVSYTSLLRSYFAYCYTSIIGLKNAIKSLTRYNVNYTRTERTNGVVISNDFHISCGKCEGSRWHAIIGNDFVILELKHPSKTLGSVNYFSVDALVGVSVFPSLSSGRSSSSEVAFQFSAYKDESKLATAKVWIINFASSVFSDPSRRDE